jgi:hypothetical protein
VMPRRIADSSSRNAVSLSSARTMKRFPSPQLRQQGRLFARAGPRPHRYQRIG